MKKLIAISVMLALVAGAAFAQMTMSAGLENQWTIIQGGTGPDAAYGGDGYAYTNPVENAVGYFAFSGANDDNNYGAIWKWETGIALGRAFVWWRPIDQVEIRLGRDGDGWFEMGNLARWGFHFMPRNISTENWNSQHYLMDGNWDLWSVAVILKPIDGLTVNLAAAPESGRFGTQPDDANEKDDGTPGENQTAFSNLFAQVVYNIDGIGGIGITYKHLGVTGDPMIGFKYKGADFVEGLVFEIGASYELRDVNWDGSDAYDRIRFGYAVHYDAEGMWGVKHRAAFQLIEEKKEGGQVTQKGGIASPWIDIMPWYFIEALELQFLCNIRIVMNEPDASGAGDIGWHVNPYFKHSMGGGHDFRIGMMFDDEKGTGDIGWKLGTFWGFSF